MTWYFYRSDGSFAPYTSSTASPVPIGVMVNYATLESGVPTIPSGWLLCDGSSQLVTSYPDLFAVVQYTYGGSGPNFSLPSTDSKFAMGSSISLATGSSVGAATHNHGGLSSGHSHTFNTAHTHGTSTAHTHTMPHTHTDTGAHTHSATSAFSLVATITNTLRFVDSGAKNAAVDGHGHTIKPTGISDGPSGTPIFQNTTGSLPTNAIGTTTTIPSSPLVTNNTGQVAVSTPSDILPPYINLYYIIKAL